MPYIYIWLGFTSHQYCKGYMATLQIFWWSKTLDAASVYYFRDKLASRTIDVLKLP